MKLSHEIIHLPEICLVPRAAQPWFCFGFDDMSISSIFGILTKLLAEA